MLTIAKNPVLNFLCLYYAAAGLLSVLYLLRTKPSKRKRLGLMLLAPSAGWGAWKHDRMEHQGAVLQQARISTVLSYMGRLHAYVLAASLLITCLALTGVFEADDPELARAVEQLDSQERFSVNVMNAGANFVLLFVTVGAYAFFFVLFSVIPWAIAGLLRSSYHRRVTSPRTVVMPPSPPRPVPPPFRRD